MPVVVALPDLHPGTDIHAGHDRAQHSQSASLARLGPCWPPELLLELLGGG